MSALTVILPLWSLSLTAPVQIMAQKLANIRFCGVICTEAINVRPQWTTYCTLNRKTLTSFVRTKPRGSVVLQSHWLCECHRVFAKQVAFITWLSIIKSCCMNHFVLPRGQLSPIIPFAACLSY